MEVAESLSQEKIVQATLLAQSAVSKAGSQELAVGAGGAAGLGAGYLSGRSIDTDAAEAKEASLLLDAAVTLCSIAAKKVQFFVCVCVCVCVCVYFILVCLIVFTIVCHCSPTPTCRV
jgi:hypothetical protein